MKKYRIIEIPEDCTKYEAGCGQPDVKIDFGSMLCIERLWECYRDAYQIKAYYIW